MGAGTIRLIKFGGEGCGACLGMKKAKTLEKFKERHPELQVVELDVNDKDGESPVGTDYEKNFDLSEEYEVEALPTLVFEVAGYGEVGRIEGAASIKQLEQAWEEMQEATKRASRIPWAG